MNRPFLAPFQPHWLVAVVSALLLAALLAGIRSGQVYVRTRGADGPSLELTATAASRRVPMGGLLDLPSSERVALDVHAVGASGQTLEIVSKGVLVATRPVGTADARLAHAPTLGPGDWVHVRLRDARGITAISNPGYVPGRPVGQSGGAVHRADSRGIVLR